MSGELKQLNMRDPRVARWYEAVAQHGESGRCTNDVRCKGCKALEDRRQELRAIPGLLV